MRNTVFDVIKVAHMKLSPKHTICPKIKTKVTFKKNRNFYQ
jgi:hypothetical protein